MPITCPARDTVFLADAHTMKTLVRLSWSALRLGSRTHPCAELPPRLSLPRPETDPGRVGEGEGASDAPATDEEGPRRFALDEADH